MKVLKNLNHSEVNTSYLVEAKGQKMFLQIFDIQALKSYNLYKTIEYNEYILTNTQELGMVFHNSFLNTVTQIKEDKWFFCQDQYQIALDSYLHKKSIKEEQALNIFSQILQSVYSLYKTDFVHRNLRPQHFVFHKGKWKLRSLVYINQNNGIKNQYTFDPQYQSPEEYEVQNDDDLDLCLILSWNLGSILLDMFCGVHFLNSQKIIKKFKNKAFTFKAVGSHLSLSSELQKYLGEMLHYNPQKRTKLQTIFENPYFSKTVSQHFKNNKQKLHESKASMQKTLVASKMLNKSSLYQSNRNGNNMDIFTSNKLLKIDNELTKSKLLYSRANSPNEGQSQQIIDEDDYFDNLKLITKVQRKKQNYLQEQPPSIENDPQIKNILGIYKTMTDRSLLLVISVQKICQIPYKYMFKEEFILLTKFSVYYASLIELNRMIRMINLNKNIFHIQEDIFEKFINTNLFNTFRTEINQICMYRQSILEQLGKKLQALPSISKNLMKQSLITQYVRDRNPKQKTFDNIKTPYRIILKKAYDFISVLYNETENEQYCRLSLYAVFCLAIDKLYIQQDIQDNFSYFMKWNASKSTRQLNVGSDKFVTISVSQLQKYLDTAPIKTLIAHSKKILLKYFNI